MPIGIALTLISLGAQALGMAKNAEQNKELERKLLERSSNLNDAFNRDKYMDYMEQPGVKNTMASYIKGLKQVSKNSEGRAAMAGSSPEAQIAEKEAINQNYGDFMRKIAAGQDAFRARKEDMYTARREGMDDRIMNLDARKAEQWNNFTKNATNLGVAAIEADAINKEGTSGSGDFLKNLFHNPDKAAIKEAENDIFENPYSSMNGALKKNIQFQKGNKR